MIRSGPPRGVALALGASAALTGLAILAFDRPLAELLAGYEQPGFWDQGITILEWTIGLPFLKLFAPIVLVAGMLVAMAVPRLRATAPAMIVLAGTHVITRFLTSRIKDATERLRPGEWLKQGGDDTFARDGGIAFPSGHVAVFASILIPLAIVAPRTRPLLLIVAYVCVARIAVNAHWLSDTLGAITLSLLVAWLLAVLVRPRLSPR